MKDAEADVQKARIKKLMDKWMPAGFGWWKIDVEYNRGTVDGKEGSSKNASVYEMWEYRSATITFNLPAIATHNDDDLEETVVHELAHLLVGSIRDYSTDERRQMTEYAVTTITRALIWTSKHVQAEAVPKTPGDEWRVSRAAKAMDAIEAAWGIIANAGGGNWENESPEWSNSAAQWRDKYMPDLSTTKAVQAVPQGEEATG